MPRFVILEHNHPELHWDLMLESAGHLRTWRLAEAPRGKQLIAAQAIPDHRLAYLDYEGPVSGNRGTVRRWDGGNYRLEQDGEIGLILTMEGSRISGRTELLRLAEDRWEFLWSAEPNQRMG
jgi:hypothetical protein